MKNRDYTLTVREVPSADQNRIALLLSALQEYIAAQGMYTAFKTEPSPEPEPAEKWIVEVACVGWDGKTQWYRSGNRSTFMEFSSQAETEAAILKNRLLGDEQDMQYRARRLGVPVEDTSVEENWVVEYYSKSEKTWVLGSVNDDKKFHSKQEAEAEFMAYKNKLNYRARRVSPAEKWVVKLRLKNDWVRACDNAVNGEYNSREDAQKAIDNYGFKLDYAPFRLY